MRSALVLFVFALTWPAVVSAQLTEVGAKLLTQCGTSAGCFAGDSFGDAVAACDFNGDGFDDLAVGIGGDTVNGQDGAGAVRVYHGSPTGLGGSAIYLHQGAGGIGGAPEEGDIFGFVLAAGDLDQDGFCDLAIGVPLEEGSSSVPDAGTIHVVWGGVTGLSGAGSLLISQANLPPGSEESAEADDRFGSALAIGDSQSIGENWLHVGSPGEDFLQPFQNDAGRVTMLKIEAGERSFYEAEDMEQGTAAGGGGVEGGDRFGQAMAVADGVRLFGAPGEDIGSAIDTGWAGNNAEGISGSSLGITTNGGLDRFGQALAIGRFSSNGSFIPNVAIGIPGKSVGSVSFTGAVQVRLAPTLPNVQLTQGQFPIFTSAENDLFGSALAAGDFDGNSFDDLAIGVKAKDVGSAADAGMVNVAYTSATGFSGTLRQSFHADFPAGMPDSPNPADLFGASLAAGDFDGNGSDDLAIGVPGEDLGSEDSAGMVTVLYGMDGNIGAFGAATLSGQVSINEENATRFFTIAKTGSVVAAFSVNHRRDSGTATPGTDFNYSGGTVNWPVGDGFLKQFSIQILEDTLDEPNETLVLELANPSPGLALGSPSQLVFTIIDDDVAGTLQFPSPVISVAEEDGLIQVPVLRSGGAASGVTVRYTTGDGLAVAPDDYLPAAGTLTFGAGDNEELIAIQIVDDTLPEPGEVFLVTLSNPGGGGTLGTFTTLQVVIIDADVLPELMFEDGFESGDTSAWTTVFP